MNRLQSKALVVVPIAIASWCAMAAGDVLRQTDGTVLYGRISARSESEIIFLERVNADNYIERRIPAGNIASLIQTIEDPQLRELNPAEPKKYLQLAEKLATFRADPEARDLAIRLYVIAADLAADTEKSHCLQSLIALGRSDDERRRLRELAFLVDVTAGADILSDGSSAVPSVPEPREIAELIPLVQQILRQESAAAALLAQATVHEQFQRLAAARLLSTPGGLARLQELAAARQHSLDDLQWLIQLELALLQLARGEPGPRARTSWFEASRDASSATWSLPTLATVTEFDPANNVFRDGKWGSQ